jgi:aspartate racemase
MKTIGLIGGMSWESSIEYYRIINEITKTRLGGFHSAKSLMISVDFAEIEFLQQKGDWQAAGEILAVAAESLERGGADFIVLCTNTMHNVADAIQSRVRIPFLHIADATAAHIQTLGMHKIGLLGTRFTMEQDFYKNRLIQNYGLDVLIPNDADCEIVHRIIYDELVKGTILPASKERYLEIIDKMQTQGAEGVILGCTEIGLLVQDGDCAILLFDTTRLHAIAAVDYALAG